MNVLRKKQENRENELKNKCLFFNSFFLNFPLWLKELLIFDCRFEFYVKNCIYSHLEMSGNPKFGQKRTKK